MHAVQFSVNPYTGDIEAKEGESHMLDPGCWIFGPDFRSDTLASNALSPPRYPFPGHSGNYRLEV